MSVINELYTFIDDFCSLIAVSHISMMVSLGEGKDFEIWHRVVLTWQWCDIPISANQFLNGRLLWWLGLKDQKTVLSIAPSSPNNKLNGVGRATLSNLPSLIWTCCEWPFTIRTMEAIIYNPRWFPLEGRILASDHFSGKGGMDIDLARAGEPAIDTGGESAAVVDGEIGGFPYLPHSQIPKPKGKMIKPRCICRNIMSPQTTAPHWMIKGNFDIQSLS